MEQNLKIYQIKKGDHKFIETKTDEDKISVIIKKLYNSYKSNVKFDINSLTKYSIDSLTYYLFVHNFPEKETEWSDFLPEELKKNAHLNTKNLTLLLFICDKRDIFVVVGGKGYEGIVSFIDHSFGLSILSKVIVPNEDIIISINSRGLTDTRSGLSEQYRSEFRLMDYNRFGRVPVEVHILLSKGISNDYFEFAQKKTDDRVRIQAGKSFKVKKSINFSELHKLIKTIGYIFEREANDYLTTYIEIKDDLYIKDILMPLLITKIYDDRENVKNPDTNNKRFRFDFCNPNKIRDFYEADYYILKELQPKKEEGSRDKHKEFARVNSREDIYNTVIKRAIDVVTIEDEFNFKVYLQGVRVIACSDNREVTSSSFLFHFTSEFELGGQAVFLVDTKWYILKKSFIEDLKQECVRAIKNNKLPKGVFDLPWDKTKTKKEGEYNLQYKDIENYIVFDTNTPDGIEMCDVMYIDNDRIYLIHVKKGFDAALRELDNQIILSSRRLTEDINSSKFSYIEKAYDGVVNKSSTLAKYTKDEFKELFKKEIVFVFAFSSLLFHDNLVEEHIEDYRSNIARYSLVKCSKDIAGMGYKFFIKQIRQK
jgi:hypothetical protein